MRRYFFQIHRECGTDEDADGILLSSRSAAMLHAVTLCAEIGCRRGFYRSIAVCVRDEHGTSIGWVSAVVVTADLESCDA